MRKREVPEAVAARLLSQTTWRTRQECVLEPQRTIVMTGAARTGTSFVSSVFTRLGLPMRRDAQDHVSGHGEHIALREALVAQDMQGLGALIAQMDGNYPVWGWKAPAIRKHFELVQRVVRNPCFVFVFKEPLSVALRKMERGAHDDMARHMQRVVSDYARLLEFAHQTQRPCLLVSYDRAMRDTADAVAACAEFAGISGYDSEKVVAGIREDARRYAGVA